MKQLLSEKKLRKGLMRVKIELDEENRISSITITGDFFLLPEEALWSIEEGLKGAEFAPEVIRRRIKELFEKSGAVIIGSNPDEVAEVILEAREP